MGNLAGYRTAAAFYKRDHITKTCMPAEGEAAWKAIVARPGFKPYSKLMYSAEKQGYRPVLSGYVTGDDAVEKRGIDLRYGWDPSGERLKGVVGLGKEACWGLGFVSGDGRRFLAFLDFCLTAKWRWQGGSAWWSVSFHLG